MRCARLAGRVDGEPWPSCLHDAAHRSAQQVRQGPVVPAVCRAGHGHVRACLLPVQGRLEKAKLYAATG